MGSDAAMHALVHDAFAQRQLGSEQEPVNALHTWGVISSLRGDVCSWAGPTNAVIYLLFLCLTMRDPFLGML